MSACHVLGYLRFHLPDFGRDGYTCVCVYVCVYVCLWRFAVWIFLACNYSVGWISSLSPFWTRFANLDPISFFCSFFLKIGFGWGGLVGWME